MKDLLRDEFAPLVAFLFLLAGQPAAALAWLAGYFLGTLTTVLVALLVDTTKT